MGVDDATTMGDAIAIVDMPIACYYYAAAEVEKYVWRGF